MDTAEWVLLDTETDGFYYPIHVVDIAAQRMKGVVPVGEPFQAYINHNVPICEEAFAVHGYTEEFLRQHGQSPFDVYSQLRFFVGNRPISAHYLNFDWDRTLLPEWESLNLPAIGKKGMCTWKLSRRVIYDSPTHKLDVLRDMFKLKCSRPHSALGDVEATVDLFVRILMPRLSKAGIASYDDIYEFSCSNNIAMCRSLIQGRSYEEELREREQERQRAKAEHKRIEAMLGIVTNGSLQDVLKLIDDNNIIPEQPDVVFKDKVFMFTGRMSWGSRSKAQAMVLEHGGKLAKSKALTHELDYLVLGEDSELGWTRVFGGKVTAGIMSRIKYPDRKLQLVLESDFVSAMNKQKEDKR